MVDEVVRILRWEPSGLGPYETVRARLMYRFVLPMVALVAATIPVTLASGPAELAMLPAAFVVLYGAVLSLLLRGHQQAAAGLVLSAAVFTLYGLMLPLGGLRGVLPVQLVLCAALGVTWLDRRPACALVGVVALLPLLTPVIALFWPQVLHLDLAELRPSQLFSKMYAALATGVLVGITSDALHAAAASSEVRKVEAERAEDASRQATDRKARFLATMSHELRTPLNAILGYAGLLREDGGASVADLERIEVSGRHLLGLVEALLELARSETGGFQRATNLPAPVRAREAELELGSSAVRKRLIRRSLATLVVLGSGALLVELAVPALHPMLGSSVPFVALLGALVALASAGREIAAARLGVWVGGAAFLVEVAATGGPESRFALYLPLLAMVGWAWLGRASGVAVIAAIQVVLMASLAFGPDTHPPEDDWILALSSFTAVVIGAALLAALTSDLRVFAEEAFRRAGRAEAAAGEARGAEEARDRFLAQVSHDLRTPLDAVVGYTELLREDEPDPSRRADLERIRSASRQLSALIGDIIELASDQAREMTVAVEAVDVRRLIGDVVDTVAPMVSASGNRLVVEVGVEVLWSDERRIRQILLNLVSNAAKYSVAGEIRLVVAAEGPEVTWAVHDQGTGLSPDQLARLFQAFVQLHEGLDRRPGVGLGLALSQRIAARLGGRILATSRQGVGSTFTLRLPVRRDPTP